MTPKQRNPKPRTNASGGGCIGTPIRGGGPRQRFFGSSADRRSGTRPLAGRSSRPAGRTQPLFIRGLNDSKQVRPELRVEIAEIIKLRAVAWAIGSACVAEIDRLNIYWASVLAMERAIASLAAAPEYLITTPSESGRLWDRKSR